MMNTFVPHRAKELKARFGSFLLKQELNIMGHSQKTDKLTPEDRQKWSFHELLAHKGKFPSSRTVAI